MPQKKNNRFPFSLPRGVHAIKARGKWYLYYQAGRGTPQVGPRTKLPDNPQSPEFWVALRQAQGVIGQVRTDTVNALIDAYVVDWPKLPKKLSEGTQHLYTRSLKIARKAWGELSARGLRPSHVLEMMRSLAETPGTANNFLSSMRALSGWAVLHNHIDMPLTKGIQLFEKKGGHQPWTEEQIAIAYEKLTGEVRKGFLLLYNTGQRGSDMVRLGPTMVDDGGFDLGWKGQVKTGVRPWCPILPELSAEISTWEKRPGPYILNSRGTPYTRKIFSKDFDDQRGDIPELAGCTLHGLRATAVVRLKRFGLSTTTIADIVGMSLRMVEHYCRFEDKRESGKAALVQIAEHRAKKNAQGTKL
jgi:integrase